MGAVTNWRGLCPQVLLRVACGESLVLPDSQKYWKLRTFVCTLFNASEESPKTYLPTLWPTPDVSPGGLFPEDRTLSPAQKLRLVTAEVWTPVHAAGAWLAR